MVVAELGSALTCIEHFIKRAKGEKSRCAVVDLENSVLYVESWIKAPVQRALEEIERTK